MPPHPSPPQRPPRPRPDSERPGAADMTETTIPFQGQTALLDRPLAEVDEPVGPSGGNRNKLLALGAVAGLLVLAVLAYFLVFAGGEDPAATGPVPPEGKSVADPVTDPPPAVRAKSPR